MRCTSQRLVVVPLVTVLLLSVVAHSEAQQYGAPARSRSYNPPAGSGAQQYQGQYSGKAAAAAQATARSNQINQGTVGSVPLGTSDAAGGGVGGPRIDYTNPNAYNGPAYGNPGYGVMRDNGAAASRYGATGRPTQGSTPQGNLPADARQYNPKAAAAAQAAARADQINQGGTAQFNQSGALNPTGNGGSYVPQPSDGLGPADLADPANGDDVSWRYRFHNGAWWYWGENNQWMYHRNGQWNSFAGAANVAPGTNSLNPRGSFDPNRTVPDTNPNARRSFSRPYPTDSGRALGQYDPRTDYRVDPRTPISNQFRTNTPYVQQVDPRLKNALPGRRLDVLYPNDIWDAYRGYRNSGPR